MSDRDPVNIMVVTAFPNPDHDKRMIRFIDSEYGLSGKLALHRAAAQI